MKKYVLLLALTCVPAFAAAPPQAPPAKAVPPPQAPAARPVVPELYEDYRVKRAEAVRRNLPLVVFVGQVPYHSDYWPPHVMAFARTLEGAKAPCVVIGVPTTRWYGNLERVTDLPGKPSLVEIDEVLRPKSGGVPLYPPWTDEPSGDGGTDFWGVPERGGPFRGGGGFRFFGGGRRGGGC